MALYGHNSRKPVLGDNSKIGRTTMIPTRDVTFLTKAEILKEDWHSRSDENLKEYYEQLYAPATILISREESETSYHYYVYKKTIG